MDSKYKKIHIAYEVFMVALVVISLIAVMSNASGKIAHLHKIVWVIFIIDVSIRFYKARKKWRYMIKNPFDIISVIPLEDLFLLARFSRLVMLFRYKNIIKRYLDRLDILVNKMKFARVTAAVIFLHVIAIILLTLLTEFTFLNSLIWVELNFFKFDYVASGSNFLILSIIIKIIGILYLGIVLNRTLVFIKSKHENWKASKLPSNNKKETGA